ncbi:MAG: TRAP transporter substrate-binding protein [Alphaproteobacteria bacterium]|nr:MAG: TRAP transporter substrate-binding protein [Alphaproteobacteria bacterium]
MKQILKGALAGAVAAASLAGGAAMAAEWRGWNIHVEGYPNTVAMDKFAELVAEKTGGAITVKMFHGGVLGSQPDAIEQLRLGAIQVANFNLGPIGPIVPEANVVSLPFIFKSVDHMFRVLEGEGGRMIAEGMARKGLLPLSWFDAGARSFYNTVRPIYTPEDVKGLKIRVMNNDLYSGMIQVLGGNPSPMAFAEVYQALKTGVVDGAENNWPSYESTGHYEVAGYYSLSEHLIIPECLCVNTDVFNSLPADQQQAVREAAEEAAQLQRKLWKEREAESRRKVEAAGVKVNEIPDKTPFQKAMEPVYEQFLAANPELRPLVEIIRNTP